jgi:hypothetical protein
MSYYAVPCMTAVVVGDREVGVTNQVVRSHLPELCANLVAALAGLHIGWVGRVGWAPGATIGVGQYCVH